MRPADEITGYHAHVYYRDPDERRRASELRDELEKRFDVELGRWRDEPVGPHSEPMYQVKFGPELFPQLVPFLSLNHAGLPVLIHTETGDHLLDHTEYALWLGEQLPIRREIFDKLRDKA